MFDGVRRIKMKTKIISLMLVLSCAGASAATALPNSSGDLRALEENRAECLFSLRHRQPTVTGGIAERRMQSGRILIF